MIYIGDSNRTMDYVRDIEGQLCHCKHHLEAHDKHRAMLCLRAAKAACDAAMDYLHAATEPHLVPQPEKEPK
jgi:hypothetical protein